MWQSGADAWFACLRIGTGGRWSWAAVGAFGILHPEISPTCDLRLLVSFSGALRRVVCYLFVAGQFCSVLSKLTLSISDILRSITFPSFVSSRKSVAKTASRCWSVRMAAAQFCGRVLLTAVGAYSSCLAQVWRLVVSCPCDAGVWQRQELSSGYVCGFVNAGSILEAGASGREDVPCTPRTHNALCALRTSLLLHCRVLSSGYSSVGRPFMLHSPCLSGEAWVWTVSHVLHFSV